MCERRLFSLWATTFSLRYTFIGPVRGTLVIRAPVEDRLCSCVGKVNSFATGSQLKLLTGVTCPAGDVGVACPIPRSLSLFAKLKLTVVCLAEECADPCCKAACSPTSSRSPISKTHVHPHLFCKSPTHAQHQRPSVLFAIRAASSSSIAFLAPTRPARSFPRRFTWARSAELLLEFGVCASCCAASCAAASSGKLLFAAYFRIHHGTFSPSGLYLQLRLNSSSRSCRGWRRSIRRGDLTPRRCVAAVAPTVVPAVALEADAMAALCARRRCLPGCAAFAAASVFPSSPNFAVTAFSLDFPASAQLSSIT